MAAEFGSEATPSAQSSLPGVKDVRHENEDSRWHCWRSAGYYISAVNFSLLACQESIQGNQVSHMSRGENTSAWGHWTFLEQGHFYYSGFLYGKSRPLSGLRRCGQMDTET